MAVDQSGVTSASTSNLSGTITADFGVASSALAGLDISLDPLQIALSGTNALTAGTSAQTQALVAAASAMNAVDSQITAQSGLVATPLQAGTNPTAFGPALAATVNSAGLLAVAVNASSYIGRIQSNLIGSGG